MSRETLFTNIGSNSFYEPKRNENGYTMDARAWVEFCSLWLA